MHYKMSQNQAHKYQCHLLMGNSSTAGRTATGILTEWTPSSHDKLPNEYRPCSLNREEKITLNDKLVTVELNDRTDGLTFIVTPGGASTRAVYTDVAKPTFVTVLVMVDLFLSAGIEMDGRLRSFCDSGAALWQAAWCSVIELTAELLYPMEQRKSV